MNEMALLLAAALFVLGVVGLVARRNLLLILVSVEVMLNGAGLAFIAAGSAWGQADGQVMFLFILAVAAAEVAVGLALVLQLHHLTQSVDVEGASRMKG